MKPNQFDALLSFPRNPGHGWPTIREAVNNGDREAAVLAATKIKSGGTVIQALTDAGGKPTCC